jgi:transcriptional regulator with XRE-family HTH domain
MTIRELTRADFARMISASLRKRLMAGQIETGEDISALRRFVNLSQSEFAEAMGISVHTLRNWEQGRRKPDGSAIGLLRIAARHPRIIRENVKHDRPRPTLPNVASRAADAPTDAPVYRLESTSSRASDRGASKARRQHTPRFLLCVNNEAYPLALQIRRLYAWLPDADAKRRDLVRVVDDSGEDYLYPRGLFVEIKLPKSVVQEIGS